MKVPTAANPPDTMGQSRGINQHIIFTWMDNSHPEAAVLGSLELAQRFPLFELKQSCQTSLTS